MHVLFIALIVALIIFIYFLPTIIASGRNSGVTLIIFLINLIGGWTVVLWLIVLFMALFYKKK